MAGDKTQDMASQFNSQTQLLKGQREREKDNPEEKYDYSLIMFLLMFDQLEEAAQENDGTIENDPQGEDEEIDRILEAHGVKNPAEIREGLRSRAGNNKERLDFLSQQAAAGNINLLEFIAQHESGGNYNIVYGGRHVNLTSMTVNEVLAWQKHYTQVEGKASSAAGKYQIIRKTLEGLKNQFSAKGEDIGNQLFDEKMQDRLAIQLLKNRGLDQFLSGKMKAQDFGLNVAKEWASVPDPRTGRSYYDGDGLNAAPDKRGQLFAVLGRTKSDLGAPDAGSDFFKAKDAAPKSLFDTLFKPRNPFNFS